MEELVAIRLLGKLVLDLAGQLDALLIKEVLCIGSSLDLGDCYHPADALGDETQGESP